MAASHQPVWLEDTRQEIKREHGKGWQLVEQSGKFKLTHRYGDGGRASVTLPWEWGRENRGKVIDLIGEIKPLIFEKQLGLADACKAKLGGFASGKAASKLKANRR